jgi:hypothetical protein
VPDFKGVGGGQSFFLLSNFLSLNRSLFRLCFFSQKTQETVPVKSCITSEFEACESLSEGFKKTGKVPGRKNE